MKSNASGSEKYSAKDDPEHFQRVIFRRPEEVKPPKPYSGNYRNDNNQQQQYRQQDHHATSYNKSNRNYNNRKGNNNQQYNNNQ